MRIIVMVSLVLVTMAPSIVGCLGYYDGYAVGIVGFDEHYTQLAVEAAHRWVAATNGDLQLTLRRDCNFTMPTDICIYPHSLTGHLAVTNRSVGFFDAAPTTIQIDMHYVWVDGAFKHVIEHELGHAFGLSHTPKGTVMYVYTNATLEIQTDAAQDVTCADVAQFDELRGIRASCTEEEK